MNTFSNSLEAGKIIDDLRQQARQLNYNKDIQKLIRNAEQQLTELGRAEVHARQLQRPKMVDKHSADLAKSIDYIQKMLLILKLIQ